ncbi:hypothetical protein [Sandarakinorhabdus sp.]|uniref:hypothetical protein n=1 Tax=Sandarakinorhabdus sp. TaxID=1916663 RepID=UPI00286EACAF|nr:hypothetical protein [Sandarakinorhabdus sp.]
MRFFCLALLIAAPAMAQAPPAAAPAAAPTDARARLLAADTNKDGKWSKAEWVAAGRREMGFNFMDSDTDGFVTPAEITAGMDKMRAMGMATPN